MFNGGIQERGRAMSLRALIFDVDGTLADTEEAHRQAFNVAFAEHGLPWNWNRRLYADLLKTAGGKERIRFFIRSLELPRAGSYSRCSSALHPCMQAKQSITRRG